MPLAWFVLWRTISGIAGGLLMILAPSFAMKNIAISQRLKVNFLGLVVLAQACYLPLSLFLHLKICLFNMSGKFLPPFPLLAVWYSFQLLSTNLPSPFKRPIEFSQNFKHSRLGLVIIIAYMCSAFAYIPHSLFWMDYLSGTLHFPLQQRNLFWVLYGVGSCIGAFVAYCLSRLIGYLQAIKCLYGVYCLAVALPFFHMLLLYSLYLPF
jgi:hypothetical protein